MRGPNCKQEMKRRQDAALRKESEFRIKISQLEERLQVSKGEDTGGLDRRLSDLRNMHDRLMNQIGYLGE